MEARGYGRPGATGLPRARRTVWDAAGLAVAVVVLVVGVLWL